MTTRQIKTYGTNYSQESFYAVTSRHTHDCANSTITRGVCGPPSTLDECFETYIGIKMLAEQLGFLTSGASGACGGSEEESSGPSGSSGPSYSLWKGSSTPSINLLNTFAPIDMYFDEPTDECKGINTDLGQDWLGCLWGTPDAPFSCTCPDIGPNFAAYLKLRLNVATFWNTPKTTPPKRAEFLDAIKYSSKVDVTVPGDFNLKIGQVVRLKADGISGFPYASSTSSLNNDYYIIGVKHVITNSGTHETALSLTQLSENVSGPATYASDYT